MTKIANWQVVKFSDGRFGCLTSYDEEFIGAVKAIGGRLINLDGRKGWAVTADQVEALRALAVSAAERHATQPNSAQTMRAYATRGNGSVSANEFDNLRSSLGGDLAAQMARQMQG